MGVSNPRNIGSHVKTLTALVPQNVTAHIGAKTANSTPSYDRSVDNFAASLVLGVDTGAQAGGGTINLVSKIQDSADNTTFADYVPPPVAGVKQTTAPQVAIAAANSHGEVDVDLSGARQFLALDVTPNLAGGATGILASAEFIIGGAPVEPI